MSAREAIVRRLRETARLLELAGESPFRARAYDNAARTLEENPASPEELVESGRLAELPGIGPGLAAAVAELATSGRLALAEELEDKVPRGLLELFELGGLGSKRIRKLSESLGVRDLATLEIACREGRVAGISGFGARLERELLEAISRYRRFRERHLLSSAWERAAVLEARLRSMPGLARWERAGSLRRGLETIGDLDYVLVLEQGAEPASWMCKAAAELEGQIETTAPGWIALRLEGGWRIDLYLARPESFGWILMRATGDSRYVETIAERAAARGFEIQDDGWYRNGSLQHFPEEGDLFRAVELPWMPPELREAGSEGLQAAVDPQQLVRLEDLRGTFHVHTIWSDGRASVPEMALAARERGWEYVGIADHSQSAGYAGGLNPERVLAQWYEIEHWNREQREPHVWRGTESDVLADGRLDYDDDLLFGFDFVVASVHHRLALEREAMTARLLAAVAHPAVTFLGHATGRLLLQRDPYDVDLGRVLEAARLNGVIVELNASPHRLDLDWRALREHLAAGGLTAINPDAHSVRGLGDVAFGVAMARKAGARPEQVVNTWPRERVAEFLAARKARARRHLGSTP